MSEGAGEVLRECRGQQGCELRLCRETHRSSWVKKERIYVDMVDFGRDSSPQLQNSLAPVQWSGVDKTGQGRAGQDRAGQQHRARGTGDTHTEREERELQASVTLALSLSLALASLARWLVG